MTDRVDRIGEAESEADAAPEEGSGTPDGLTGASVAVVGGGPAGCAAAIFLARYGFAVQVFDRGASSIRSCAFLENYPGFPGGIDVETFCTLITTQAQRLGGDLVRECVVDVTEREEADGLPAGPARQFRLETDEGRTVTVQYVVAATAHDGSYLTDLADGALADADAWTGVDETIVDADGRTPVDGLYVAGPLGGVPSQAVIAAGQGARSALALLADHRESADGLWTEIAETVDWTVAQGRHAGDDWFDSVVDNYASSAPADVSGERATELARAIAREQRTWQIDDPEATRRRNRAHRDLAAHLDRSALAEAFDLESVIDAAIDAHGETAVREAVRAATGGGESR